jgi:hypothetical protein
MAARSVDFPAFGSPYNKINLIMSSWMKTFGGVKPSTKQSFTSSKANEFHLD